MTTKVHAVVDGFGNPLHFMLTPGNVNDITVAQELLSPFRLAGKAILADKGYDSGQLVTHITDYGGTAVIPSRITNKQPRKTDWHAYKERHLVEKVFLKLKNYRRFATRYEKSAASYRAVVYLSACLIWLL